LRGKVDIVTYKGQDVASKGLNLGLEGSVVPHICRSGCWVPPWLDKAFTGFVEGLGRYPAIPLQHGDWNPMTERWNEEYLREALENERLLQEQISKMRVGTVKASEFLNCKVEQVVSA